MASYAYVAVDQGGVETRGIIDVTDQDEALRRIRQMGLFPTRVSAAAERRIRSGQPRAGVRRGVNLSLSLPFFGGRVKPAVLAVFTRQLATLVQAGMPLLRGLRTLEQQEENHVLKRIIGELAANIEGGGSLSEACAAHPRVFNRLFINMVKAGEMGGALELTLRRLAQFLEKAQRIKSKVKAAMFYPCTVILAALVIVTLLMVYVVPVFVGAFQNLLEGRPMPAFTAAVLGLSLFVKKHFLVAAAAGIAVVIALLAAARTKSGRWGLDTLKLKAPILGPVFRKLAISRFSRTLGTLVTSGVPILQALTVVKETVGNVVVGRVVADIHENVKQGEPIAPTLKASGVFPVMVAGMVDVGEQTGALPDMLMNIADTYDEEVDNAVSAMTSLLEPIMILFLGVVVGCIVTAMFLPIITILINFDGTAQPGSPD